MSSNLGRYYKSQVKLDGKRISNNQDLTWIKLISQGRVTTFIQVIYDQLEKSKSNDCMITNQWKGLRQNEFTIVFFLTK